MQNACAILYFDPWLVSLWNIFYIISNTAVFSKKKMNTYVMCFLIFGTVCLNYVLLYEVMTRYYGKWQYDLYKIPDMIFRFQINLFFLHRFLRNIQRLNLMSIHRVKPPLLQSERHSWRISYTKFVIMPTPLKWWWSFLVSFHRLCLKLVTFTFN